MKKLFKTTATCLSVAAMLLLMAPGCSSDNNTQQNNEETSDPIDVMPQESTQPQEIEPDTVQTDTLR